MSNRIVLCLMGLFMAIAPDGRAQDAKLQGSDLVAVCGDSITEQKQYSLFIADYLLMCQPQKDLRVMQFGWGGETAGGFNQRVVNDALRFKPTVATTCYGMNDGGYAPLTDERATNYRMFMTEIVQKLKSGGVRFIVVGSPGCVDTDTFRKDPKLAEMYNTTLAQVRDIAREVANEQGVAFADVYSPMLAAMAKAKAKYGPEYHVGGPDGVHPSANGHLVMAYAFLKALGCDGAIGTINIDLETGKATATDGHKVIESSGGTVEIESTRYPFCFTGDASSPAATSGIVEFLPFNEELNQYRLVAINPGAERVRVTWGEASKEFPAEQLAKGINLAAEFPSNPFSEPFAAVQDVIRVQQNFQTPMIKRLVNAVPTLKEMLPDEQATIDRLVEAAKNREGGLQEASRAAVKPVRHHILVAPAK
jgi:lysophospholipase L1-like esterase